MKTETDSRSIPMLDAYAIIPTAEQQLLQINKNKTLMINLTWYSIVYRRSNSYKEDLSQTDSGI
ncbi:MAG: hypothetical protein M0Q13_01280 [Methanothrix sp.]|nr:hypothetical protein [Methanothrix sp.]